jgi:hypothetical protein
VIFQNELVCRGFTLCYGSFNPGEEIFRENTGDGVASQAVYVYYGGAVVTQNGKSIEMLPNQINDMSEFMNAPYDAVAGDAGSSWVAINPAPATKKYTIELLPIGDTAVTSSTSECVLLCVDKEITCNSKTLTNLQYTRILNGKTATVNVPEGAVAALMTV